MLSHVGREDVLQEDLVDPSHRLHFFLLDFELGLPEVVGPGGELDLAVQDVEEDDDDGEDQGAFDLEGYSGESGARVGSR